MGINENIKSWLSEFPCTNSFSCRGYACVTDRYASFGFKTDNADLVAKMLHNDRMKPSAGGSLYNRLGRQTSHVWDMSKMILPENYNSGSGIMPVIIGKNFYDWHYIRVVEIAHLHFDSLFTWKRNNPAVNKPLVVKSDTGMIAIIAPLNKGTVK